MKYEFLDYTVVFGFAVVFAVLAVRVLMSV